MNADQNNDGFVDMTDINMMLAKGASFAEVSAALTQWNPRTIQRPGYKVPIDPPGMGLRNSLYFDIANGAKVITEKTENSNYTTLIAVQMDDPWRNDMMPDYPGRGIVLDGFEIGDASLGLCPKVRAPKTSGDYWILFRNCSFSGANSSVPCVDTREWKSGVYTHGCFFRNIKSCIPGVQAHVSMEANNVSADLLHNVRGTLNVTLNDLHKIDPTVHPDVVQHAWTSSPGPVIHMGLTVYDAKAQGIFFRSPGIFMPAVCLQDIMIHCTEGNGYVSQIMGSFGEMLINNFKLANQKLVVRNDPNDSHKTSFNRWRLEGMDVEDGIYIDPSITVQPEVHP